MTSSTNLKDVFVMNVRQLFHTCFRSVFIHRLSGRGKSEENKGPDQAKRRFIFALLPHCEAYSQANRLLKTVIYRFSQA